MECGTHTHREPAALAALTELVTDDNPTLSAVTPAIGESYQLWSGAPAKLVSTARSDAAQLAGCDWQNDYADLAVSLEHRLARISDPENRRRALADMRRVLEKYAEPHENRQKRVRG